MAVSVVMPARNAAATLSRALESLLSQSLPEWEAIVVDDGSSDETAELGREWERRDPRIRLLEGPARGVSAARNAAIAAAAHPLLLFLDADDELCPDALEVLCAALDREPTFAGAYGRWARVAPDTRVIDLYPASVPGGDLFPLLATYCVFAIHTCVVRRDAVERVGGFDTSFSTCEDWDMWQRIARIGGRFLHVPTQVALYHLSSGSASSNALRLMTDGLVVAERGHTPDPRLDGIEQRHPHGAPTQGLAAARILIGCWSAGLAIGEGVDPLPLLDALPSGPVADLDPEGTGLTMYESAIRLQPLAPADIAADWDTFGTRARGFLDALEVRVAAPGLAEQAIRTIERRLVLDSPELRPITIGATHAADMDLTQPLTDLACPAGVDRAVVGLTAGEARMGSVELPVLDGVVPAEVVSDVDGAVAWRLLERFFERSVYPALGPVTGDRGWTAFLREIWDRPAWEADAFYDPGTPDGSAATERSVGERADVEVAEDLPTLVTDASTVAVTFRVGGRALGVIPVDAVDGRVEPQRLRAELTTASGYELCRLAVVRALVGRPLADGTLRSRLADAARARLPSRGGRSVLGRHPSAPIGSSASRSAWLPGSVLGDLAQLAAINGQPFRRGLTGSGVLYAPELVDGPPAVAAEIVAEVDLPAPPAYGRHHFEELLATTANPWRYESAYERRKYAHTLELIPRDAGRVLEIGCAEGHFTVDLAPLADELVAADLSEVALSRARKRCDGIGNVSFVQLDVARDPLPGEFDVIVCSELLYYVGADVLPVVAKKLAAGLRPDGVLVLAHANLQVDEPDEPGFDWALPYGARHIGDVLGARRDLTFVRELRTPYYRVQRFERAPAAGAVTSRLRRRPAPVVDEVPFEDPDHEVAASFRWTPAERSSARVDTAAETWHLPILMYHRVADDGPEATARWRIGVDLFERQLSYLADAGFRTVTLAEWRAAAEHRRPIPGRAVVLTFDDAYVDFEENAWPLLERHGFGAVVAVVTELVGGVASWDARFGEPPPLLGWDALRSLSRRGVELASHAVTHAPLTALSVEDMARECARSRLVLERETGCRITTIVYPYGAHDPVVEHVSGGVGYLYGLAAHPGLAAFRDPMLALPRQEITGDMSFGEFVRALAPPAER